MNYVSNSRYGKFGVSISYYLLIVINKIFYTLLILLSIFMLIKQKKQPKTTQYIRETVFSISKPQLLIVRTFDILINKFNYTIKFFSEIKATNKLLKNENLDMKIKLLKLDILENENNELKNILNYVVKNSITNYSIKKINIISNKNFVNKAQIKIDNKDEDKIKENDLVIDNKGNLIGRIVNLSKNSAEILLLTDTALKLPAKLEISKVKVLLEGNENENLKINFYLGEKLNINEGELVFTADDGDVLQDGILIGKIVKNSKGQFEVKMSTNLGNIDYAIILHRNDIQSGEKSSKSIK